MFKDVFFIGGVFFGVSGVVFNFVCVIYMIVKIIIDGNVFIIEIMVDCLCIV